VNRTGRDASGVRRKHARGNVIVFSALGLAAVIALGIIGGDRAFTAYDRSHPIDVTCEVRSARASTGGSTSSRGVGTLFDQVEIETDRCGPLVLRRGVTAQNKKVIAKALSSAGSVGFRLGAASYRWRDLLRVSRTPVVVESYTARSSHEQSRSSSARPTRGKRIVTVLVLDVDERSRASRPCRSTRPWHCRTSGLT
jgi:hypothetical protein